MVNKELFKLLEEYSQDKGITFEEAIETLRKSLEASSKKVAPDATIKVTINPDKHEIMIYKQHMVVETLSENPEEDSMAEITLADAKKIKSNIKVGDILSEVISPKEDFGRQTARSAKSTFASNIKGLERKKAYDYFKSLEDEMISADVLDVKDKFLTLSIGQGITTILPVNQLLPNDHFVVGDRIRVYVKKVEETTKDPKVKVSRTDRNLITRLMESFIPEVKDGIIEIKGIARDPGSRCKIAVYSNDPKVDALGSCVGENGNRINEVVTALNGEKIDLYKWSDDPEELIAESLQPAKVTRVINVDVKEKSSLAVVPDDQLSLAIGKAGQNVRLAVQSCGWKIDIKPTSQAYEEGLLKL